MQELKLERRLPPAAQDRLQGRRLGRGDYDLLIEGPTRVLKPDGELLLVLLPGAVPQEVIAPAWRDLRRIEAFPSNRSVATVGYSEQPVTKGGYRSNTTQLRPTLHPEVKGVSSAIIGYYDRNPRYPLCRLTAFNMRHPARWARILPFVAAIDRIFAEAVPERYAAQHSACSAVHPDFRIAGTAFTTLTVNKNWQTLAHRDAGDFRPGFGVLHAFRAGEYSGGLFCYPGFRPRVAVDLRTRDVLLSDVHEWHGNTPLEHLLGPAGRLRRRHAPALAALLHGHSQATRRPQREPGARPHPPTARCHH